MYLGRSLRDFEGREHGMTGVLGYSSRLDSPQGKLTLGYRTVRALDDTPLLCRGEEVRGHEFHRSALADCDLDANAYDMAEPSPHREGFRQGNVLASYVHLHLASKPGMAKRFVDYCAQQRRQTR